ncbi:hypothetical protein DSM3645_17976, partial [Blastopirellula marina DSM 3645]
MTSLVILFFCAPLEKLFVARIASFVVAFSRT